MTTTASPEPEHQSRAKPGRGLVEGASTRSTSCWRCVIIASASTPAFLTGTNLTNLMLQMSIIGVVVMAELIVVLTGGIDISVGSALGLAAVLSAGLFGGSSVFLALIVALVVGGVIGAVNGWLVAYRGLEPFIVTLGMLALARGLVYAYGEGIRCSRPRPTASPRSPEHLLGLRCGHRLDPGRAADSFRLTRTWGPRSRGGSNVRPRASSASGKTPCYPSTCGGMLAAGRRSHRRFASRHRAGRELMERKPSPWLVIGGPGSPAVRQGVRRSSAGTSGDQQPAVALNVSTFLRSLRAP